MTDETLYLKTMIGKKARYIPYGRIIERDAMPFGCHVIKVEPGSVQVWYRIGDVRRAEFEAAGIKHFDEACAAISNALRAGKCDHEAVKAGLDVLIADLVSKPDEKC